MIRQSVILLHCLWSFVAFGQDYPFAKDFKNGTIIFKDSSRKTGQLKWFPHQNEKLKFRETDDGEIKKYSPEEIAGFTVDTLKFVSLYNLEIYSDNYALLGKTSKIKQTFGQLIDTGKFNIYFVLITGYNALSGAIQTYPNFLFKKTQDDHAKLVAYPVAIRMKDKKYEKAKEELYTVFADFPDIIEKLKTYKQQDDFYEIIHSIKTVNRQ